MTKDVSSYYGRCTWAYILSINIPVSMFGVERVIQIYQHMNNNALLRNYAPTSIAKDV